MGIFLTGGGVHQFPLLLAIKPPTGWLRETVNCNIPVFKCLFQVERFLTKIFLTTHWEVLSNHIFTSTGAGNDNQPAGHTAGPFGEWWARIWPHEPWPGTRSWSPRGWGQASMGASGAQCAWRSHDHQSWRQGRCSRCSGERRCPAHPSTISFLGSTRYYTIF